jgi:hypothetical protein
MTAASHAVPQPRQQVTRSTDGSIQVVGVNPDQQTASHADANSANGAFRPTPDFPAIGAAANRRVLVPLNPCKSLG